VITGQYNRFGLSDNISVTKAACATSSNNRNLQRQAADINFPNVLGT